MSFDTTYRYFAFDAPVINSLNSLRSQFGQNESTAPRHKKGKQVKTLVCGLDNSDTGELRAGQFGFDVLPITLSDGRLLVGGYWATGVVSEFEQGRITGEELTVAQVKALQPISEI